MTSFIYQYNQDPWTRECENVQYDTAPPKIGDHIWRKIGSQNLESMEESMTTIYRTRAAVGGLEKFFTEYVIGMSPSQSS